MTTTFQLPYQGAELASAAERIRASKWRNFGAARKIAASSHQRLADEMQELAQAYSSGNPMQGLLMTLAEHYAGQS